MKVNRKLVVMGVVVAAGLLVALLALRGRPKEEPKGSESSDPNVVEMGTEAQRNISLGLAEVSERQIHQVIKATGIVSPDETRVAHILPLAQGVVENVFVQLGSRVTQNQPLILYDNIELGELIGEHLSLHGNLEKEKAQLQVAKRALERADVLIQVEAISPRDYDLRTAEKQQAEAAVASKQAELDRVEEKLHRFGLTEEQVRTLRTSPHGGHRTASHNILRAPFAGVITKYEVSRGELVSPEKELFTIVDTSSVWVLADVYEKDISLVPQTGDCSLSVSSYPGEQFKGKITYVADFLDPDSRTAKVRCIVANRDRRLKLDMFADVLMPTTRAAAVLTVPAAALQEINGEPVVFVRRDDTHFLKRTVRLGQKGEQEVEVLSGVNKGEKVVTIGSFQLKSEFLREQIGEKE